VLAWLSVWIEVQIVCIWSSWCHCIPKPHRLLPHLNPDWFYLSGTGLPRCGWKRPLNGCSYCLCQAKISLGLDTGMQMSSYFRWNFCRIVSLAQFRSSHTWWLGLCDAVKASALCAAACLLAWMIHILIVVLSTCFWGPSSLCLIVWRSMPRLWFAQETIIAERRDHSGTAHRHRIASLKLRPCGVIQQIRLLLLLLIL